MKSDIIETDSGLIQDVTIRLPLGLHSRPSARLAQTARSFDANIQLATQEAEVDAKSMLDVLSLALKKNDSVRIIAKGPDAQQALIALHKILTDASR